jgi:hypothetical protein
VRNALQHRCGFVGIKARDEHVCLGTNHFLRDARDLIARFSFTEDDFRNTLPKRSMMVDGCKTKIFEREALERSDGIVDVQVSFTHQFEQFTHTPRIHGRPHSMFVAWKAEERAWNESRRVIRSPYTATMQPCGKQRNHWWSNEIVRVTFPLRCSVQTSTIRDAD